MALPDLQKPVGVLAVPAQQYSLSADKSSSRHELIPFLSHRIESNDEMEQITEAAASITTWGHDTGGGDTD